MKAAHPSPICSFPSSVPSPVSALKSGYPQPGLWIFCTKTNQMIWFHVLCIHTKTCASTAWAGVGAGHRSRNQCWGGMGLTPHEYPAWNRLCDPSPARKCSLTKIIFPSDSITIIIVVVVIFLLLLLFLLKPLCTGSPCERLCVSEGFPGEGTQNFFLSIVAMS